MSYDVMELSPLKRNWLLRNSNIPRRFLGMEPSDFDMPFPDVIEDWLEDVLDGKTIKAIGGLGVTGVGLLFDGEPGLGKTTHAVVAAMEFIRRLPDDEELVKSIFKVKSDDFGGMFRPVYYLTFPEFLARKKDTFDLEPEEKRNLSKEIAGFHGRAAEDWFNVRVLVIDDLGKEYGSKYDDSSFDEILRSRYDRGLPTIITTNHKLENWDTVYKSAMSSFANEAFHRVRIVGGDLRRAK
jgi:DNA replication protein DnaC